MMRVFFLVILQVILSTVNCVLTDPGLLCPQRTVVLNCTGGQGHEWRYDMLDMPMGVVINNIAPPPTEPVELSGVQFTFSQLSPSPNLITQISFMSSQEMNGKNLTCLSAIDTTTIVTSEVTLAISKDNGPPRDVMVSNMVYGIEQVNVTIEWTPPTNGGNVMYTIGTTPAPLSGAIPDTDSTHISITVNYNTNYMVTVAINTTCDGVQEATTAFIIAGCPHPSVPENGMILDLTATNEGAEITYQCGPDFQPQNISTAVCGSNGLWSPDPALHDCTVDCGQPEFPSNSVVSAVSSTTEGATVTFQCEEGLFPSDSISTCSSTGQWTPNPADVQCRTPTVMTTDTFTTATTFTTTTTTTSSSDPGSPDQNSTGIVPIVSGVVVTVVVLIISAVVIVFIIVICIRRGSGKKVYRASTELQETPMMEYNTLDTRGYNSPTHDGYSSVIRDTTMGGQVTEEYSTVQHAPRDRIEFQAAGEEYSQLNTHKVHPGEEYSQLNTHKEAVGGVVYADLGPQSRKKENLIPNSIPEDRVVYSAIDTKATTKHQAPDATLDLNMMLIQVREVIPKWNEYGQALGVPPELLKELEKMRMGDYEKLVEMLDYWFRQFPQGSQPTWRDVAIGLQGVGLGTLAADIMKVYTTGQLPISVSDDVPREAYGGESEPPPPLPPKIDEEHPPKPKPRVGSLKAAAPPRPPKSNLPPSASIPPRPPKASAPGPLLPPKPRND